MITKQGGKFVVKSHTSGRKFGSYTSKADAVKRLQQMKAFSRETLETRYDVRDPDELIMEVSPPGWEGTVKAMKSHKDLDNPYALAWSMKNKGFTPHYKVGKGGKPKKKEAQEANGLSASTMGLLRKGTITEQATGAPPVRARLKDDPSSPLTVKVPKLKTKEEVNYRYATDQAQSCRMCQFFKPIGKCEKVEGLIRAVDTCDLFEPKSTEEAVQPKIVKAQIIDAGGK